MADNFCHMAIRDIAIKAPQLLGLRTRSSLALVEKVNDGLPFRSAEMLAERMGFSLDVIRHGIGVTPRTFARRKEEGHFTGPESDRLLAVSRLYAKSIEFFDGDIEASRDWLNKRNRALGGKTPLVIATTETGRRVVENLIDRLEHGVYV